jgi:hypothetical protein
MAILGRATGQRRSDLERMRPAGPPLDVLVGKRRDKPHWVPLTSAFAAEIDRWAVPVMTPYLLSTAGRRYTGADGNDLPG